MATDTFFKKIVIDDNAANIIIAEMEKHVDNRESEFNEFSVFANLKRGEDLFQQRESRLKQLSARSKK